jgi:hypothetical protein
LQEEEGGEEEEEEAGAGGWERGRGRGGKRVEVEDEVWVEEIAHSKITFSSLKKP